MGWQKRQNKESRRKKKEEIKRRKEEERVKIAADPFKENARLSEAKGWARRTTSVAANEETDLAVETNKKANAAYSEPRVSHMLLFPSVLFCLSFFSSSASPESPKNDRRTIQSTADCKNKRDPRFFPALRSQKRAGFFLFPAAALRKADFQKRTSTLHRLFILFSFSLADQRVWRGSRQVHWSVRNAPYWTQSLRIPTVKPSDFHCSNYNAIMETFAVLRVL